ncbi:MAG: hypothetical protein ABIJ85_03510 [bacterium]
MEQKYKDAKPKSRMMQKISHFSFHILLPLGLFLLGAFSLFNYLKTSEFGVLNLNVRTLDQMVASRSGELLKGDQVTGTFRSEYTNLGIISLRFYNQDRDSKDTLVFRLKEQGQDEWYYEAKYETDQFQPHKHFPFGFPVIKNSDGKNYQFQIESLRGATGSGILVDYPTPTVFTAKSSYTKNSLMSDKKLLVYFLTNKFINIFGNPEIRLNTFFFFLPFILFVVFLITKGLSYQYLTLFALVLILYDVFWLTKSYDFLFLGLLFFWGLISFRFRFEPRIAAVFALGFLVLTPIVLISGQDALAEKTAVWAYLFLCITVAQQVYELKKETVNLFSLNSFIRNFPKFVVADNYWMRKIPRIIRNIFDFHKRSLSQFTYDSLVRSYPGSANTLVFWLKMAPAFVKKLVAFSFISLVMFITICLVGYFMVLPPFMAIYHALPKFISFFPENYLARYVFTLVVPELVLLLALFTLFSKVNKKLWIVLALTLLFFNLLSGVIRSRAISFESEPKIISVSPNETSEAWTDVVITGKNFRDLPFIGKIYLNTVEQGEYMIYWSNEKIVFRTSPDLTKSGMIKVVPLDRSPSNTVPFSYTFK